MRFILPFFKMQKQQNQTKGKGRGKQREEKVSRDRQLLFLPLTFSSLSLP